MSALEVYCTMAAAPGEKMEWADAWKIANVTATFIGTVGLRRWKKIQGESSPCGFLQMRYLKLFQWLGKRGQGWGWGAGRESGMMFVPFHVCDSQRAGHFRHSQSETDLGKSSFSLCFSLMVSMLFHNGEWHINDAFYGVWSSFREEICHIWTDVKDWKWWPGPLCAVAAIYF